MEPEVIEAPTPYMQGTFAVYETPDGGRVIAYRPDGGENATIPIPGAMMRLWDRMASGEKVSPMEMMKAVMGK